MELVRAILVLEDGRLSIRLEEKNQIRINQSRKTTNNRMELLAVIIALEKIKISSEIVVYTDSTYLKMELALDKRLEKKWMEKAQ